MIGFSQCEFSIEENARDFSIEIQVLHGLLEESLVIMVTSQDGSAESMTLNSIAPHQTPTVYTVLPNTLQCQ